MVADMGKGFGHFVDDVLRGRINKTILNSSVGLAALEMGLPAETDRFPASIPMAVVNNRDILGPGSWSADIFSGDHPLFDLSQENLTLFGLDFPDFWRQLQGEPSEHHTPIYEQSVAESLGLPDLPYGEMAHFAHMGMALYDTGRTFQDLWNEPTLKHNALKILTHPDLAHTVAARGTMLTVMGLLHPLGPVVAIGVSYLCMHLVHSFFGLLERNKETIREIEHVPVLSAIYNASGIKEWAERDIEKPVTQAAVIDPYQEVELYPNCEVNAIDTKGKVQALLHEKQANPV